MEQDQYAVEVRTTWIADRDASPATTMNLFGPFTYDEAFRFADQQESDALTTIMTLQSPRRH